MQNKKGFTLVELLAVIVILAVLVLLAVPNVLKTMDNARKNTFVSDANSVVDTFKKYVVAAQLDTTLTFDTNTDAKVSVTIATMSTKGYIDKSGVNGCVSYDKANNSYKIAYSTSNFSYSGVYPVVSTSVNSVNSLQTVTCP